MNVDISWDELMADRVWLDVSCGRLFIQAGDFVNSLEFAKVPDADFESSAAVKSFSIGPSGSVVVCHHKDGKETWLPTDMWLSDGISPTARGKNRLKR